MAKTLLELAENHAECEDARTDQEKQGLHCVSGCAKEGAAEDLGNSINQQCGDGQREAHDWSKPKQSSGWVAHSDVLVAEKQLCQAPTETT